MKYSIVIPCYKSAHTIRQVVEETSAELERIGRTPYEFVLVDDFSPDEGNTVRELRALAEEYDFVTSIALAHNVGQHNALIAGLNYAEGDIIVFMDDDMQTHPSQLDKLISALDEDHDVVYGYYPEKKHSGFRRFGSWFTHMSVRVLIGKPKDMKTSSYLCMKKYVRDYIIQYPAHYTQMQGLILRTVAPSRIASVPIQHFDRAYGESGYTIKKLLSLWSNIAGFSIVPLRFAQRFGVFTTLCGVLGLIWLLVRKLISKTKILGWTSTMMTIIIFSGIILVTLGVVGEYVGRMFLTMGNYPQFVVREIYKSEPEKTGAGPSAGPAADASSGPGSEA
ncbi:MAG: glycosyltransferase [Mogibacterium sp.]|nr:glycosyltransferase [Mogibacterium sp.]